MKKRRINWSLLISLLALLVSIITLCLVKPHCSELGFDYQGVIVGILSLLVTALIGWNIYTTIDLKGKIDEFKYAVPISLTVSLAQLGRALFYKGYYEYAISAFLNALAAWEEGSGNELMEEAYTFSIKSLKSMREQDIVLECSQEDFKAYMDAALKTRDDDIISYVKGFKISLEHKSDIEL